MLNRSTRNHLLPLLLSFALLLCYVVPVTAKSAAERAKTEEPVKTTESTNAVTMQLMKMEGDVSITNDRGKDIFFLEKMRLYSGYHVETHEASYAWINLDGAKLTKLDAVSEMEVRKSSDGDDLEILLNSGKMFFNVTEPLADDETLKVRTSTMTVGIRGTSGWVEVNDRGDTRVYLLEGTVECGVTDPVTGQTKETALSGSDMADFLVYPQEQEGDKCDIIRYGFTEDDVAGFVLVEAVQDEELCREIYDACGLDLMACADEAEERLKADQEEMHGKMQAAEEELAEQEHNVAVEAVWEGENAGADADGTSAGRRIPGNQTVNGSEDGTAVALEEGDNADVDKEEAETITGVKTADDIRDADSAEELGGSAYAEQSDGLAGTEEADGLWSVDDLLSLVDPDLLAGLGTMGETGDADKVGSLGGADSAGSSGDTEENKPEERIKLTVSEASENGGEKLKAALEKYDVVEIVPDADSSLCSLTSDLDIPAGRTLEISSSVDFNIIENTVENHGKIIGTMNFAGYSYFINYGEVRGKIIGQTSLQLMDGTVDYAHLWGINEGGGSFIYAPLEVRGGSIGVLQGNEIDLTVYGGSIEKYEDSGNVLEHTGGTINGKGPSDSGFGISDSSFGQFNTVPAAGAAEAEESGITQDASSESEDLSDEEEVEADSLEEDSSTDTNPDIEQSSEADASALPDSGDGDASETNNDNADDNTDNTTNTEIPDNSDSTVQQPPEGTPALADTAQPAPEEISALPEQPPFKEIPTLPEQSPHEEIPILPEQLPVENTVDEYIQVNREEEWDE